MKKLDVNDCSFAHLTLILLLHYLVECRSRSLAVYNNEFILVANASAQKIIVRPQNHWKNDRLYVPTATKKRYINAIRSLKTMSNFSKSVMVSIALAVSNLGASNIHVLEPGVKINGAYYRDVVLRQICFLTFVQHLEASFSFFSRSMPHHIAPKTSSARILSHPLSGRITHQTSTQLATPRGVCFRNESISYQDLGRETITASRVCRYSVNHLMYT